MSIVLIINVNTIKIEITQKVNSISASSQIDELSLVLLKDIDNISVENKSQQSATLKEIISIAKPYPELSSITEILKKDSKLNRLDQSLLLDKQSLKKTLFEIKGICKNAVKNQRSQIGLDSMHLNSYWTMTHTLLIIACLMSLILGFSFYKIRKTKDELSIEKDKADRLFNKSVDNIISCDKNGFITEFNQASVKTFGYTTKEIIGKHISLISGDDSEAIMKELAKKGIFSGKVTNVRKDGSKLSVHLSANLIYDSEGNLIGSMGISRSLPKVKG